MANDSGFFNTLLMLGSPYDITCFNRLFFLFYDQLRF